MALLPANMIQALVNPFGIFLDILEKPDNLYTVTNKTYAQSYRKQLHCDWSHC